MIPTWKIYPRSQSKDTVYLKNVITDPTIEVGDYTYYDDFVNDPRDFQKNNVLYHYPECNPERLIIGKFCSIGCGAKFIFNSANHDLNSLCNFPFPVFFEEWGLEPDVKAISNAWENKGDIIIGNDVWIGGHVILLPGVHIGDGAVIGAGAVVAKSIPPYAVAVGNPARVVKYRDGDKNAKEEHSVCH